jgi:hypothetical protein
MLPKLQMNAFLGTKPHRPEDVSENVVRWGAMKPEYMKRPAVPLKPAPKLDLTKWSDPGVGWGLIMTDLAGAPPPSLKKLLAYRGKGPVLRYMSQSPHKLSMLRDDRGVSVDISGSALGNRSGAIPYYLLIYGPPTEIPWSLQYVLNMRFCVGRIDLTGEGLENYVSALLNDFSAAKSDPYRTLTCATDHGQTDITHLMRTVVAEPLFEAFQSDSERKNTSVLLAGDEPGSDARTNSLINQLEKCPGLIATTSHGQAEPEDGDPEPGRTLGWLVDQDQILIDPGHLLSAWDPGGAIWYSHACCSAGSDGSSIFEGLFPEGSETDVLIGKVVALGAITASFPKALLGAKNPARAFIGHVEPTFDWTLQRPAMEQPLTSSLIDAIININRGEPIGHAFKDRARQAASLLGSHELARDAYNHGSNNSDELIYLKLASCDIQSTVIFGDPAVALSLRP